MSAWAGGWFLGQGEPRSAFGLDWLPGPLGIAVKTVLPLVVFFVFAPLFWALFRRTWRELDDEALEHKLLLRAEGRYDYRPVVLFAIVALVLTLQEYYGGRLFYFQHLRPALQRLELAQGGSGRWLGRHIHMGLYGELYGYGWWALTRVVGYTIVPLVLWKIVFRKDQLLDVFGLRVRGMLRHAWLYGIALAIVLPPVLLASLTPEFTSYYPFYKKCWRSWVDYLAWEAMYLAQFFALEVFFRGFMVSALRKAMGSGAIFAMCVPYVMIHYGKPFHEACGAMIAGVFLGSLAMRARSIYWGCLVHMTVALFMDASAIVQRAGLPKTFWPTGPNWG